jgi:hypothetical protein
MSSEHDVDYTESFTRTLLVALFLTVFGVFSTKYVVSLYHPITQDRTTSTQEEIKANE